MRLSDKYVAPIDIMDVIGFPGQEIGNSREELSTERERKYLKDKDLTGMTFGKLHVDAMMGIRGNRVMYFCTCECGNKTIAEAYNLMKGRTKSCGCLRKGPVLPTTTDEHYEALASIIEDSL